MQSFSNLELRLFEEGIRSFAGVDEAGRGPLAGPVVAAAVVLPRSCILHGIDDSKKLGPSRRQFLAHAIGEAAVAVGIGIASHEEIDRDNILEASIRAMHRAIDDLGDPPRMLLVDGNRFSHPSVPFQTLVGGDARCFCIAAASIIAKVTRDGLMMELEREYPGYGFARHKGYPTAAHIDALRRLGPSPVHRRSFMVKRLAQPCLEFAETSHGQ